MKKNSRGMIALGITVLLSVMALVYWSHPPSGKDDQSPATSGALKGLQLLTSARTYPREDIPATGTASAFESMQTALLEKARADELLQTSTDPEPWQAIGPRNIGGRTLAIAFNPQNPNTIYAGSASGGLWRSTSGGIGPNAWEYVPTGFPVLGVSSIAIAPEDSNIIYIGTGEVYGSAVTQPGITGERLTRGVYGIGILKSTDGGQTWRKSLDWLFNQRRGVQMVKINPLRPESVWAATTEGTYKSVDAGQSWRQVHDVVMATDIEISPQDTSTVFVACGGMTSPGHGIYRSQDSGASWEKMQIPGVTSFNGKVRLAMSPASPNIIYASIGRSNGAIMNRQPTGTWLVRTIDDGDSWTVVSTNDYSRIQGWYAHDVAVHPTNPDIVWTAGQAFAPLRSNNGGFNLNAISLQPHPETAQLGLSESWADFHHIEFHPANPNIIYFANDGGVFRTEDSGITFRNCSRGYQTTQFYNGTSSSYTDSLFTLGGMQDNNSAAYSGSREWQRLFGGDGSWTAINQDNNDVLYVSLQWLNMAKSLDGGRTFKNISPPHDNNNTNFIAPYVLSPVDNLTLYAGSNVIHKSTDGGDTWHNTNAGQRVDINAFVALVCSEQDVDVVYGATSPNVARGKLFRTRDGGESWTDITANLPDRFPTDLALEANDDRSLYVTLGGFGSSHLFHSPDGGDSWRDVGAGLPDVPTWSVIVDPDYPQQLFVGNDLGVFFSADGGAAWAPHAAGLPDAIIAMDLTISRANRMLRVATHGNGFYESGLPTPAATNVAGKEPTLPETILLLQNYPNPFNPETRIRYFGEGDMKVNLSVYNTLGQKIIQLVSALQTAGWHEVVWNGKNAAGEEAASGLYLYRLRAGESVLIRKMSLLR